MNQLLSIAASYPEKCSVVWQLACQTLHCSWSIGHLSEAYRQIEEVDAVVEFDTANRACRMSFLRHADLPLLSSHQRMTM